MTKEMVGICGVMEHSILSCSLCLLSLELKGRILPVSYSLSIGFAAAMECQATERGEQTYTTQVDQ